MINPKDLLDFFKERRSIRSFKDTPIPDEEIEMILEAGRASPSASNIQPWEFIVIKNKEIISRLASIAPYGRFISQAPVVIAIVGKIDQNPTWYIQDTTLVSMNMMLMAWALGIGTCWIGSIDREKAKTILGIPGYDFLLTVLPMGYISGNIPNPTPRKDMDKIKRIIE
ncbi:MAG: nitroreductase [Promethearchaeota archaeon]|nr:MAG: nitroreductase [Candidatus Lokiarchaeota archaeon]